MVASITVSSDAAREESAPPLASNNGATKNELNGTSAAAGEEKLNGGGGVKGIMRKGSQHSSSHDDLQSGTGDDDDESFRDDKNNKDNKLGKELANSNKLDTATSSGNTNSTPMLFSSTNQVFKFLKDETVGVVYSRRLVYFVILSAAVILATLTYVYLTDDNEDSFNSQYDALSIRFTNLVHAESRQVLDSFVITSRELTSTAVEDNVTWPFFIAPSFERHSQISRQMTKTLGQVLSIIVREEQRAEWELFTQTNQEWINESISITGETSLCGLGMCFVDQKPADPTTIPYVLPTLTRIENGTNEMVNQTEPADLTFANISNIYLPFWQHSPVRRGIVNIDSIALPEQYRAMQWFFERNEAVFSEVLFPFTALQENGLDDTEPHTYVVQPIYSSFPEIAASTDDKADVVGFISSLMQWNLFFSGILRSDSLNGLILVLKDPLERNFTYRVDGSKLTYLGRGDKHESKYNHMAVTNTLVHRNDTNVSYTNVSSGEYIFTLYPSSDMESQFENNEPLYIALGIVAIFLFAALNFTIYNNFVQNRQNKVMAALTATSKVIASLFPANILDRLMKEAEAEAQKEAGLSASKLAASRTTQKSKLRSFLDIAHTTAVGDENVDGDSHIIFKTKPIADLYTSATVMYADIVGFTAWSSVREPTQVFTLLETVFRQYDLLAKRRRVFKVETIGDCYVSVCGVPDPRPDHAVVMARYAMDCLHGLADLSEKLAVELGPDTSELGMRIGMHSGPVTAGILRGEKSRFQLFGDTVRKCQYMEKTSAKNRVQISQQTADLLVAAGKSAWIEKRLDNVEFDVDTYWVIVRGANRSSTSSRYSGSDCDDSEDGQRRKLELLGETTVTGERDDETAGADITTVSVSASNNNNNTMVLLPPSSPIKSPVKSLTTMNDVRESFTSTDAGEVKIKRLVEWNAEILIRLLKQVVAFRKAAEYVPRKNNMNVFRRSTYESSSLMSIDEGSTSSESFQLQNGTVIDEVVEIIDMPEFNSRMKHELVDSNSIELDQSVCDEIRAYVAMVAALYRDNPFHNFEHASHVIMSVSKLLSRIVAPDIEVDETEVDATESGDAYIASTLHDHTYGITSDPMTQFACVFSALIHDVDHPGVPNAQLIKEKDILARLYNEQSVAEQNSIDIAWRMFMDDSNTNFRTALCPTTNDIVHFRQLVVNSVMATDIVDKKLKELRNNRWDVAFKGTNKESVRDQINRKATIVIEHLIQASDVSHTMQHWHVYCRWNEMFYHEMYRAYKEGRAEKDPSEFWYKGEIGFYDFYIIPLAKKLKDCGVFGVSSDEYLNYAMKNRAEWEQRGEEVVAKMVEHYRQMYDEIDKNKQENPRKTFK